MSVALMGRKVVPSSLFSSEPCLDTDLLHNITRTTGTVGTVADTTLESTLDTCQLGNEEHPEPTSRRARLKRQKAKQLHDFLQRHGCSSVCEPLATGCFSVLQARIYPIHKAAKLGDHEMLRLLLQAKADPLQKTSRGRTAAEIAEAADRDGSHQYVLHLLQNQVQVLNAREVHDLVPPVRRTAFFN
ncbi:unnamed protein product [Symbiodinium natans]|uniref:Uncharacterized protein n=1 Tax=Symbiodinium natans TaxID=878477 RepID=A0A812JA75_9DINO|nr:unnamed protein product [Symbiodinium natans]